MPNPPLTLVTQPPSMEGGPECKAKPIYPTLSIAHLPPYSCCSLWGQGRTAGYVMHSLYVFYPDLPSPSWSPRDLPPLRFLGWRSWTERRVTTRSRDWGSCLFCILFPSRQSLEFPSGTVKSIILLICAEHPRPHLLWQLSVGALWDRCVVGAQLHLIYSSEGTVRLGP